MLTILHGDDSVRIHTRALELTTSATTRGILIERPEAKSLSVSSLEALVGTDQLFSSEKLIWIDRLYALPKSSQKDALIAWITDRATTNTTDTTQILLTEDKVLTPTQLKKFTSAKIELFKLPQIVFSFIESIGSITPARAVTQFHEVLKTQEAEFVFAMMVRQFRMLLMYVADGIYDGPPFSRGKIINQAKKFTQTQLLQIHKRLLAIDLGQKTSSSPLTLSQEIDLLLLEE